MKSNEKKIAVFLLLVLALLLSSCTGPEVVRLWMKAPGWSRAQEVGLTEVKEPVSLAVDSTGDVYMFLVTADQDRLLPQVIKMNRQGEIVWKQNLDAVLTFPKQPEILWDGQTLHLFWISARNLYTAQLNPSGEIHLAPQMISQEKVVETYAAVGTEDGDLIVWFSGTQREPGLYALPAGSLTAEAQLVDAEGIRPSLRFDPQGRLHALWVAYPIGYAETRFYYQVFPEGDYQPGEPSVVYRRSLSTSSSLRGPWFGIDSQQAYMFWTVITTSGYDAGTLTTYLHFPLGAPSQASEPEPVYVPTEHLLTYRPAESAGLNAGRRVPLGADEYPMTASLSDVAVNPVVSGELAIAFEVQAMYTMRKVQNQVAAAFFQQGIPSGYQLLSFTSTPSMSPNLLNASDNSLYLTWLERNSQENFLVYFASTAPDIKAVLDQLNPGDYRRMGIETAFGMLSGAILTPIIAGLWSIVPLFLLGIMTLIGRKGGPHWGRALSSAGLIVAIAAYMWIKFDTLPGMDTFVPFLAWIPVITEDLYPWFRTGVPLLIALVSLLAAYAIALRRSSRSAIFFLLIFIMIDGCLTLACYGIQFYSVL